MDVESIIRQVQLYYPDSDPDLLRRAFRMAQSAHASQERLSGEAYVQHPLATAEILADMHMDPKTIAAALIHDVPEDTEATLEDVRDEFGDEVAALVDGVTKLSRIEWENLEEKEAESLRKMFLAIADDIRIVLVKLADRLHNMRTLWALPEERQKRIAQETLDIFAPLASRLGIWQMKWELEDLSFRYLNPQAYREIADLLSERRQEREEHITGVIRVMEARLDEEGIKAEVTGRPKHIYSIYRKMQEKGISFDQVYDVRAVRVTLGEVKDCYAALGLVHSLWRPIPGEFDDYIASPKENMYQSLHTAIIGLGGRPLEVQIRTHEMHRIAEYGIAAHWRYKEGGKRDVQLETRVAWLRQLIEWRKELASPVDFVDSIVTDDLQNRVYVFTPKGEIVDMPAGSTPVDFAYYIHTEVGHQCRGARANGRLVSLSYHLHSGDRVEILTSKKGGPSRDWLNPHLGYVATTRARQKIRQWFRQQKRSENIVQGREILERELHRLGLEGDHDSFEKIARQFKCGQVDDFLAAIGYGDINPQSLATKLLQPERKLVPKPLARKPVVSEIQVMGARDLLTRLAQCCNPLPGDDIAGYITLNRGVTVHRADCPNIQNLDETERLVEVSWSKSPLQVYPVPIRVEALDRAGLLRDIAAVVAEESINMSSANVSTAKDSTSVIDATLEISDISQLSRVLSKIEAIPDVLDARRESG